MQVVYDQQLQSSHSNDAKVEIIMIRRVIQTAVHENQHHQNHINIPKDYWCISQSNGAHEPKLYSCPTTLKLIFIGSAQIALLPNAVAAAIQTFLQRPLPNEVLHIPLDARSMKSLSNLSPRSHFDDIFKIHHVFGSVLELVIEFKVHNVGADVLQQSLELVQIVQFRKDIGQFLLSLRHQLDRDIFLFAINREQVLIAAVLQI